MTAIQRDAWWFVLGLCLFALLGNCVTQFAYVGFGPTWPKSTWQERTLRFVGFGRLDGVIAYALYFIPYFAIAAVGASKLHGNRVRGNDDGLDAAPVASNRSTAQSGDMAWRATVLMAALAAVTVPALPSLVYLLFVVAFCTSEMRRLRLIGKIDDARDKLLSLPRSATVACLCYTAIHFMAIYMYQLPELQRAARASSAQFLGLYSMAASEGALARLLRLTQLICVGGLFMGLCAVESHNKGVEGDVSDGIRTPLIDGENENETINTPELVTQPRYRNTGIVPRLLARFGGILVGFLLLTVSLLVVNVVAYPMLLIGLVLMLSTKILKVIKESGVTLLARIAGLLLAAIAVQMLADAVKVLASS